MFIADDLGLVVDDPDAAVGPDGPVVEGVLAAAGDRRPLGCLHPGPIVRMDEREERLGRPGDRAGLDAVDPVQLVGALGGLGREVPFPAADVGDPLRLGEVALAPAESVFESRPLLLRRSLFGDVRDRPDHPHRSPGPVELQRAAPVNPAFLAGVGADDLVLPVERLATTDHVVDQVGDHGLAVSRMDERGPAFYRSVEGRIDPEDRVETL